MFLMNTVKRVIKNLPKVDKETDEGRYQWYMDQEEADPMSENYEPFWDTANPECPANPANPAFVD